MRFYKGDEGQLSLPRDFVSSLYLILYTLKKYNMIMIKSYKSIPDRFAYRKDTWYRFRSLVNEIFVREMRDN